MAIGSSSRRRFLGVLAFTPAVLLLQRPATAEERNSGTASSIAGKPAHRPPKVGIALGAGGANGLAHILMLEALDEMDIRPHRIAGSSIGAIIGALYAAGQSGRQIRGMVEQFIVSPEEHLVEELLNQDALRWLEFIEIELGGGGLLSSEEFIAFLYEALACDTFEKLEIPLRVTAADLWSREQVVLEAGPLLPAIKASMALPGVFHPVAIGGRVLVDGGTVNPVPYDLLSADCDIVIGIDVTSERTPPDDKLPGYFATIFNSISIMQRAIMEAKLRHDRPAVYIRPRIIDIRALEFYRASRVFEQARPAKQELKQKLGQALDTWPA
jgi:NTE family protein